MSIVNIYHFYGETLETIPSRCFGKHRIILLTLVLLCSRALYLTCVPASIPLDPAHGQGRAELPPGPCSPYDGSLALCTLVEVHFKMVCVWHRAWPPTEDGTIQQLAS